MLKNLVANIPVPKALEGKKALRIWGMAVLKLALLGISAWYLYHTVVLNTELAQVYALLQTSLAGPVHTVLLSVAVALLFANWGLEALKWQQLLSKFQHISFSKAFRAILAGTSVSLWVPNRAGEYLGRIFFLRPAARVKGVLATLIGSVSQLLVTLVMGLCGLMVYEYDVLKPYFFWSGFFILVVVFIVLLLLFYFNIHRLRHLLPKAKWARPLRRYLLIYTLYNNSDLRQALAISLGRYLVFCTQFYLLLQLFGVQVPVFEAFSLIFFMYLIQTASPTGFVTELMVRGTASVFLFSAYAPEPLHVLAASYTIWLINLIIPAATGLVVLLAARVSRNTRP